MHPDCTPTDWARVWSRVAVTPSCWLWLGYTNRDGYGIVWVQETNWRVHRLVWEWLVGPVPDGLNVLHDCPSGDNPACVNPGHLWLGTHQDNIADRHRKARDARGDQNGTRRHPERLARGDDHWTRIQPNSVARGERHGSQTHPERLARGSTHGSRTHPEQLQRGEANAAATLTVAQVLEIRTRYAAGNVSQSALAREYHQSHTNIWRIVHSDIWRHVP